MPLRRLCVFLGSRPGRRPEYLAATRDLGRRLAEADIGLVYGGTDVGLMRELANSALAAGGEVIGVVPRVIEDRGVAHRGLTELRVVETMHERKQTMAALSDGFIALPGGFGTLEELFEAVTWLQLGVHHKPIGLLGPCGYWGPLLGMVEHMMREGFVPSDQLQLLLVESEVPALLARMQAWVPPRLGVKWVEGERGG